MTLPEFRKALDEIDNQLLELLAKRADVIPRIREAKAEAGLPPVDPKREREVLERLSSKGAGAFPKSAIEAVFREVISASVSMQEKVRVGFLGPEGTYSHLAARKLFGYAPAYQEEGTISSVIESVARGRADFGVVPLENSSEGSVASTIDALLRVNGFWKEGPVPAAVCLLQQELVLGIHHCLITAREELLSIERLYSHPQALAQCRGWIHENLPHAQLVHTPSTAAAVARAKTDAQGAALGSELSAELHHLPILRREVQDEADNQTRFVVLASQDAAPSGHDQTTVAFMIPDDQRKGSLRRTLETFEHHEINLTRIESRPVPGRGFRYVFVADAQGHRTDSALESCLTVLEGQTERLLVLGSYSRNR